MANQSPERKGIRQSNCPFRLFCPLKAPSPHCATLCTDCKNGHPRTKTYGHKQKSRLPNGKRLFLALNRRS
ncbi:hypothetical protein WCP94_002859 [Bilophila wadsworthia]